MKNGFILLLLAAIAWLAWDLYTKGPKTIFQSQTIVAAERYGQSLRTIADSTFSPLDTAAPNPESELTKLVATAETDLKNGKLTAEEAAVVRRLCNNLKKLNTTREAYETEYQGILARDYSSLAGQAGGERKRQFFLDHLLRKWTNTTQTQRPVVANDLAALRSNERQQEYDQQGRVPSTAAP